MRLKAKFYEDCSSCKSVQGNVYPIISTNPICVVQIKFIFRHCQQLISNSIQLNLLFPKPKAKIWVNLKFWVRFGKDSMGPYLVVRLNYENFFNFHLSQKLNIFIENHSQGGFYESDSSPPRIRPIYIFDKNEFFTKI